MQRLGCFGLTAEMQNGSSDDVYCSKQLRSRPEACAERGVQLMIGLEHPSGPNAEPHG